jgi:YfiH family protein
VVSREAAAAGFLFASSLRSAGDFSLTNSHAAARLAFLAALQPEIRTLFVARQVHGARICPIENPAAGETLVPDCDGFIGGGRVACGIFTADCLAVALIDRRSGLRALVHSGWRGTLAGIAERALEGLLAAGSLLEDLIIITGPSLQACCYRVGDEFLDHFGDAHLVRREGAWYFDNQGYLASRLIGLGVPPGGIFLHPQCSFCRPERWFSYRRDKDAAGRTLSLLAPLPAALA